MKSMDREEYAAIAANQGICASTESAELQQAAEVHPASCPQDRHQAVKSGR